MTEQEFEAAFWEELAKQKHKRSACGAAKAVAVRAGLQFEPELEPGDVVPATLQCKVTEDGLAIWPGHGRWLSTNEKIDTLRTAVARHNAYPSLRKITETLVRHLKKDGKASFMVVRLAESVLKKSPGIYLVTSDPE